MKRRHVVELWRRIGAQYVLMARKSYRNPRSAMAMGQRWNKRHCHETRNGRQCPWFVLVNDHGLDPVIVPSVGEVGYY